MKNPRHLFILIGFLAQAITWDSYLVLLAPVILWMVAVKFPRERLNLSITTEGLVMAAGCALSILATRLTGRSAHFFLGDGLIFLQLVRLARPLTKREKLTSLVIACFHFGVLCTLAPDIRFILLFTAAVILLPKALKEVLITGDDPGRGRQSSGTAAALPRRALGLPRKLYPGLLAISVIVFLTFPRFTGTSLQLRDGLGDQGSLLDSILDPRRRGRANSQEILMQVEGDDIGYLRCFALTEFDGVRWWANRGASLRYIRMRRDPEVLKEHQYRKVFVKNAHYLGRVLPVDGRLVNIRGNFFDRPMSTPHGVIECTSMWSTANNVYEYWVDKSPDPEGLSRAQARHLLYHPEQSQRLKDWVSERTAGATNAVQKASLLAHYLRRNFKYKLGTPELNRLSPVEDFIFNRKEGHCERFAAALALMLRMEGIPSRVVIGYAATKRNLFSGRLQVRFSDAHSWTEGWFEGEGWVTLDATPGPPSTGIGSDLLDLIEALDFAWYSHVVNFNGFAQKEVWRQAANFASGIPESAWSRAIWGVSAVIAVLLLVRFRERLRFAPRWRAPASEAAFARHSYGRMLSLYHRAGHARPSHLTPFEFLEGLRTRHAPGYNQAAVVTDAFCRTAYARVKLPPEAHAEVESALQNLKQILAQPPRHGATESTERSGPRGGFRALFRSRRAERQ